MSLDKIAEEFGLSRLQHEPDNNLWSRIEGHADFSERRDEIIDRLRSIKGQYKVPNQEPELSFLEELEKI